MRKDWKQSEHRVQYILKNIFKFSQTFYDVCYLMGNIILWMNVYVGAMKI
jgi:hypothetical protein